MATPEMTNVFNFMELRAPYSPEAKALRRNYIRDDFMGFLKGKPCRIDADLQSDSSLSEIGKLIYSLVFCPPFAGDATADDLVSYSATLLPVYKLLCPGEVPTEGVKSLMITELERRPNIRKQGPDGDFYYLLPERLEHIEGLPLLPELLRAYEAMARMRVKFDLAKLTDDLKIIFGAKPLSETVFHSGIPDTKIGPPEIIVFYSEQFLAAKRKLFDALYILYVLRRRTSVNLEYVIEGLQVLHVLEALAVDELIQMIKTGPASKYVQLRTVMNEFYPELKTWSGAGVLPETLPLIQTKDDFAACFTATPVIHPIFARGVNYKKPFNDIKPICLLGDLKVVKQWLVEYLPGEISHIQNVLKGEAKEQTHRRLEKTDETFSFSSSSKESSQSDTQSTNRFELKQEAEKIVKSELNLGANASFTYNTGTIVATVGANFGYKRDSTDQSKTSSNLARDVISKAVQQVEKNATEARSITKIFETEETNKHTFDNRGVGTKHITGIYRWLDKKYKAQLFNYDKRMMFEFMIPEPAAFFVESRLRNFETTLEIPEKPKLEQTDLIMPVDAPEKIDETKFKLLKKNYDLTEYTYPIGSRKVFLTDANNKVTFTLNDLPDRQISVQVLQTKLGFKYYQVTRIELGGRIEFHSEKRTEANEINTLELVLQEKTIDLRNLNIYKTWYFDNGEHWERTFDLSANPELLTSDDVSATVKFQSVWKIANLTVCLYIQPAPEYIQNWQIEVFRRIEDIEVKKVEKYNQEERLKYNSKMSEFNNRMSQLKAQTFHELIQGQSEAFNREIIRTELKKHCLTMITKEFDFDDSDDLISKTETIKDRTDKFIYSKFKVDEYKVPVTASFEKPEKQPIMNYPSIVLDDKAREKDRFVQFLEQAFEWQQLAYIFYPYFWANQPKWVEMMNRSDDADPNMSAFLQAGYVKVLIAVTPAYDSAVMHFLATREPWMGGPAPVIGDPLFIPLHEELRKRQDDLHNATPEGEPWTFVLPTSLIYLDDSGATLPKFPDVP